MKSKYMTIAAVVITVIAVSLLLVYALPLKNLFGGGGKSTSDIIISVSPVKGGTVSPESGVYRDTYQKNTNFTVTVFPAEGYAFQYWEISNATAVIERPRENPYNMTLTEDSYVIEAVLAKTG